MADYVKSSHVFLDNPAKNVDEALEFLSKKMVELGYADDEKAMLDAFKARESEGTTGMMDGLPFRMRRAMPSSRRPSCW